MAEAIREIGPAAIEPLVARIESEPALLKRKAALGMLGSLPARELRDVLHARLGARADAPDFVERATTLLALASVHPEVARELGATIVAQRPDLGVAKGATREERALRKKCAQTS